METKVCPKGKAVCDCESTGLKLKKLPNVKILFRFYLNAFEISL